MKNKIQFAIVLIAISLHSCTYEETEADDLGNNDVLTEDVINEEMFESTPEIIEVTYTSDEMMQSFYDDQVGDLQVVIKGSVIKVLADDNEGSRHQKFLVELESGQTLLVSHNIDLADRVTNLKEGDQVIVNGEYEWNDRGGVIHWTHHDPAGKHEGGWIEHNNTVYE